MACLILKSPAKLNLYLKVLNKRVDGYHNILSVFERLDLCDIIWIKTHSKHSRIQIFCDSPAVPKDKSNLAFKAAWILKQQFNIRKGISIRIKKRIPVGSGLGGGSSNAACILLGLNKIFNLKLDTDRLLKIALKLGADVGFFILNKSFALGIMRPDGFIDINLQGVRLWHILAVPKIEISTKETYENLGYYQRVTKKKLNLALFTEGNIGISLDSYLKKSSKEGVVCKDMNILTKYLNNVRIMTYALKKKKLELLGNYFSNDLAVVSQKRYPEILQIINSFRQLNIKAMMMTGSGPAVFGIVRSRKEAVSICKHLRKVKLGNIKLFFARTL